MSGTPSFAVPRADPLETFLYLAPLAPALEQCAASQVPPLPPGCLRVVCISDTHNEHEGLRLPAGDVLVHAGDVLTESGLRHVVRDPVTRVIKAVKPQGELLFVSFARWLGRQAFDYKVLVAGNHDLVLQGLGRELVQKILTQHNAHGQVVYLEDSEAKLGPLRVFGSPFGHYGSHNDAFKCEDPSYNIQPGVHIVVTHMPAVLPARKRGTFSMHGEITEPLLRAGALLHVGGHCHWANGLYFAQSKRQGLHNLQVPCVVASVSGSEWLGNGDLASTSGFRGDPADKRHGGYNLIQPGIICDLALPELARQSSEPAPASGGASCLPCLPAIGSGSRDRVPLRPRSTVRHQQPAQEKADASMKASKPRMLLFAPPNDPGFTESITPLLEVHFVVDSFALSCEAILAAKSHTYAACVAKLGQEDNLGVDVIAACRGEFGQSIVVAVHSATAMRKPKMRAVLETELGVSLLSEHGGEPQLVEELFQRVQATNEAGESAAIGERKRALLFAPVSDPDFAPSILPFLKEHFEVDRFERADQCAESVKEREYATCVVKLGQKGNLGVDVIAACRRKFGAGIFVAVHSATAARDAKMRAGLTADGVDFFAEHGGEQDLVSELAKAVEAGRRS